ncbi:MFS general substrate transporter [Fistulina hepatica ATCC 64428]|uniref:MFS general substrate transporter n=1 Tax=Fistulina hepatica ATCC 64428 TaxID=1128425 RepID=A0A0D7A9W0_9AGAR|nr:MFS general substrate transporter [Fistulina hepatica ATCC 64428]
MAADHSDPYEDKIVDNDMRIEHIRNAGKIIDTNGGPVFTGDIEVTEADSRRIVRQTDIFILPLLIWVYFLQILDKSLLGFAASYGLKTYAHLQGNQYSIVGSMNAIAQLAWMPFSSYLLVRITPRRLMPIVVIGWGASLTGMAFSLSFSSLVATRFLLGLFEAVCIPLFTIITSIWYRRAEQPLRVAAWYSTNGFGTIFAALLSWAFAHIQHGKLHGYQITFLACGLATLVTGALIHWRLDNNASEARFLSPEDRIKATERLRVNKTGLLATDVFKWGQVFEAFLELKMWLFFAMALLLNVGASVINVFGPLILDGLNFDQSTLTLLNMPLGAVQFIVILASSYAAQHYKIKSIFLLIIVIPVIVGMALLYTTPESSTGVRLFAYYFMAFLFGGNPLIVSWVAANTGGLTKKSVTISAYNAASAAGNIIGPYLFTTAQAPRYIQGLRDCLGIFVALFCVVIMQMANIMVLNHRKRRQRVRNGKPEYVTDLSMAREFHEVAEAGHANDVPASERIGADELSRVREEQEAAVQRDLTDQENDQFVYLL